MYQPYVELAARLCGLVGDAHKAVLFTTGAEGIENAVKIARAHTRRSGIIAFSGGFHGRSLLALTMTRRARLTGRTSARSRPTSTTPRFPTNTAARREYDRGSDPRRAARPAGARASDRRRPRPRRDAGHGVGHGSGDEGAGCRSRAADHRRRAESRTVAAEVRAAQNVVRLLPPLTASDEEITVGVARLDAALLDAFG